MARVKTLAGIATISGRVGDYCFRTMRATGKVFMHKMPSKGERLKVSGERKEPSEAMKKHRERFRQIAKTVSFMLRQGSQLSRQELWTLASAAYDAAHK